MICCIYCPATNEYVKKDKMEKKKIMVTITKEVEYCSLCPFGSVSHVYYDREFEQECMDVYCSKQKCMVHDRLHWTEIAAKNSMKSGLDVPPESCPFNK